MLHKKYQKVAENYHCEKCDYNTCKKSNYKKHLQTKKHNATEMLHNATEKYLYNCSCGKTYKHHTSYYRHKKDCIMCENKTDIINIHDIDKTGLKDMFFQILEQNQELMKEMRDIAKEPKIVNNTTNTQFNVMNYLNTECKDAMNFTDFIDNFEFTVDDLQLLADKGYQETMEKTFIQQLKDMDKTKRPIHCSDKKRKSFYVKENGVWKKDDENKTVVSGVKRIASRHFTTIHKWRAYNPDCFDDDRKHIFFNKAMGQVSKCDDDKQMKKVINHLSGLGIKP